MKLKTDVSSLLTTLVLVALYGAILNTQCVADVFDNDPRLNVPVTVHAINVPMRDILAEISQQTGVTIFADNEVADDKASVNALNRKAADLLHAILPVFHYVVSKGANSKVSAYSVHTDSIYQNKCTTEHRARSEAIASQILIEGASFEKYSKLTNDELEVESARIQQQVTANKEPADIQRLRTDLAVVQTLSSPNVWLRTLYNMLLRLPRTHLVKAIDKDGIWFYFPGDGIGKTVDSENIIPQEVIDQAQRLTRDNPSLPSIYRSSAIRSIRFHLYSCFHRDTPLQWELSVAQGQSRFTTAIRQSGGLPLALAEGVLRPSLEANNRDRNGSQNKLNSTIDVIPPFMESLGYYADNGERTCRLGDVLSAISEKVPFDFVADGFWSGHFRFEEFRNVSLEESLSRITKMAMRSWHETNGFQTFGPSNVCEERQYEPPATRLTHWLELLDHSQFTMDEFAELATLPQGKLTTLVEMSRFGVVPPFVAQLQMAKSHLELWNGFDRTMRRLAYSEGVAYKDLPANLQRFYLIAATDPAMTQYTQLITDASAVAQSRIKVVSMDVQQWRVKKPGPTATWRIGRGDDPENGLMNREDALRRFQMLDKSLKLKDILPVVQTTVSLIYSTPERTISRGYIELPLRWESGE